MKQKAISMLLCTILLFSLTGCGKDKNTEEEIYSPPTFDSQNYFYNPLTGEPEEEDYTSTHMPVAVTINNIKAALPQYGVSQADIIYETVAEGGITRMLAVFSDPRQLKAVGSVRSARPYFVKLALSLNCTLFHFGGSEDALNLITSSKMQAINGITTPVGFYLDEDRRQTYSREHCFFTDSSYIQQALTAREYNLDQTPNRAFCFLLPDALPTNITYGKANQVQWDFSGYDSGCQLRYNPQTLEYEKYQYGGLQIDGANSQPLSFDNCFILFDRITTHSDGVHMGVDLKQGDGYYFTKGTYMPITWSKDQDTDPIRYFDQEGAELQVNIGKSYVAIVSNQNKSTLVVS